MFKVTVNGKVFYAQGGTVLSDLLTDCGDSPAHPCGGKGICKKCSVLVNGRQELSCRYVINSDVDVCFDKEDIFSPVGTVSSGGSATGLCFALDIGTTTLALALVSVDEKRVLGTITAPNPQRAFGADVISRIEYCSEYGMKAMQSCLAKAVNSMCLRLWPDRLEKLYVSGNTTMLHTLFGADCSGIGVSPYTPSFLEAVTERAELLGITQVNSVESVGCIHSYFGSDLVCGMNYTGIPEDDGYYLLVDLGTNAEIALYSSGGGVCTSAAAGPCFEGADIACGMCACEGAVYSYSDTGYKTAGDVPAKGICGTGLIDIVAVLLNRGVIDKSGFMECERFEISDEVYLSREDVRQLQLAKSAVFAAIKTLIKTEGVGFDKIKKLFISGGFSAGMNVENAVRIGLIPAELKERSVALENSSLQGIIKYACEKNDLTFFYNSVRYIDLSLDADFSTSFINSMMFEP